MLFNELGGQRMVGVWELEWPSEQCSTQIKCDHGKKVLDMRLKVTINGGEQLRIFFVGIEINSMVVKQ